jgi:hypothetical protein
MKKSEKVLTAKMVSKQLKKLRKLYAKSTKAIDATTVPMLDAKVIEQQYTLFQYNFTNTLASLTKLKEILN